MHLYRVRLGVVSLKEINGEFGRVKLIKYWHSLVFKNSKCGKSLMCMDHVEFVLEMFINSYGFPLKPSGSWIVGGVLSQFIGNKPHNGCKPLVDGKPMSRVILH